MFQHILVPLDGSTRAEQALPIAARLARASQGAITLLQVVNLAYEVSPYGIEAPYIAPRRIDDDLARARDYLAQRSHDSLLAGIPIQTRVAPGNPAEIIITQAEELPIDLIIITSHGYTGMKRWVLGSVAEKIARHALVPVLILREGELLKTLLCENGQRSVRALVPLDTSPRSQDALAPAAQLIAALSPSGQGELHLAQMVVLPERTTTEEQRELLQAANQNLTVIGENIREGLVSRFGPELHPALSWSVSIVDDVAEGIVQIAEESRANGEIGKLPASDVIALTTHGFGGIRRWQVGSTAERVLHATRLPVLLVRPEDMIMKAHQQKHYAGAKG